MGKLNQIDVSNLPGAESDLFEYKSSNTPFSALGLKLGKAASGFWNSGGGLFIAGVDGTGQPDGGVDLSVGRNPISDWVDQVLQLVSPTGKYSIRLFKHDPVSSNKIHPGKCVLAVEFEESVQLPHMAPESLLHSGWCTHSSCKTLHS
jgi:hypothetical protein